MPRAAVAQFMGSASWEENIAAVARLAARAAEAGVHLLCFHELASTVYLPFAENPGLFALAEPEDGPSARDCAAERAHVGLSLLREGG
jgi:predicted amidohydrolase